MYHLHTFSCTYFYSHPREGGDIEDSNFVERQYISIHAPAKGATIITDEKYHNVTDFYSRPREGGDSNGEIKKGDMVLFLFTPPRRGRHIICTDKTGTLTFLFTPPRRGRLFHFCRRRKLSLISIHAPAKGATSTANRFLRMY